MGKCTIFLTRGKNKGFVCQGYGKYVDKQSKFLCSAHYHCAQNKLNRGKHSSIKLLEDKISMLEQKLKTNVSSDSDDKLIFKIDTFSSEDSVNEIGDMDNIEDIFQKLPGEEGDKSVEDNSDFNEALKFILEFN